MTQYLTSHTMIRSSGEGWEFDCDVCDAHLTELTQEDAFQEFATHSHVRVSDNTQETPT